MEAVLKPNPEAKLITSSSGTSKSTTSKERYLISSRT
jgi:hypothetical protein